MTDAKAKCSQCGAELTNLTFSWGKRQWLWGLFPIVMFIVMMIWLEYSTFRRNQEYATEIQASLVETHTFSDRVEVIGLLKNVGTHAWERISVQAEVFDEEGKFLDEGDRHFMSVSLRPDQQEHFKATLLTSDEKILKGKPKIVLKVTDASEVRF